MSVGGATGAGVLFVVAVVLPVEDGVAAGEFVASGVGEGNCCAPCVSGCVFTAGAGVVDPF